MANTTVSPQSKDSADRAITEAMIGVLRMTAERGDPQIVRVQYRTQSGALAMSPYGLYVGHDKDRLEIFTGQAGQETLVIPREMIDSIRFEYPSEIVRTLNGAAPSARSLRTWYHASA